MSKEHGKMTAFPEAAYSLRESMSKIIGVRYEIRQRLPDFPPQRDHASWYLLVREFREPSGAPYASVCWEDKEGNIFVQSMYIGNTTEWIGPVYGEKGLSAASRIDFSDFNSARSLVAEKFPDLGDRLTYYESVVSTVSSKYPAMMSLSCDGSLGTATFHLTAEIPKDTKASDTTDAMKRTIRALKEAWDDVREYEARLDRQLKRLT